jgi:hypothetical protein
LSISVLCHRHNLTQPYSDWTKKSLRKHIEKAHPYADFSDAIIDLLWTCFYFYAYHPFPRRDFGDGRIKWSAFQRSVSLLAARGTGLLGTLEDGDYSWRYDECFTRRVNFNRILRSISHLKDPALDTQQQSQPGSDISTFIVDDVMDVLAMTQPQDISVHPSPDLLKPVAERLIGEGATPVQFWIKGGELSLLLSLLLRLRLHETKWARKEFHYGTFDEQCPQDDELAHVFTDRLAGEQHTVLTSGQAQKALDMLVSLNFMAAISMCFYILNFIDAHLTLPVYQPNLEFYFHQLWSTLFQPPLPANISVQETAKRDHNPGSILRMISLFVSRDNASGDSQTAQKNPQITLDASSSQGLSDDLSLPRLIKALTHDSSQCNLIIILGNTSGPSPAPVVMGALFPDMPWATKPNDTASKLAMSHILFQLQPKFRLLRWTRSHVPLPTDFIYLDDDAATGGTKMQSLKSIAAGDGISQESYWIGAPGGTRTGLHINPYTRMATLRTTTTSNKSGKYEDIGLERNVDGDAGLEEEFSFTVNQIAAFKAESGTHANVCSGETSIEKDDPRYGNQSHETKIEGEELAKRIQGFGST